MEKKDMVLKVLKDIIKSNKELDKNDLISLKDFMDSSETVIRDLSHSVNPIERKIAKSLSERKGSEYLIYAADIKFVDDNEILLTINSKEHKDDLEYKFKFENDDLVITHGQKNINIMQVAGEELLKLLKAHINQIKIANDFSINNENMSINLYFSNKGNVAGVKVDLLDYITINKGKWADTYEIICESLNTTKFVEENLESILNNIFIPKEKCHELVIEAYEKKQLEYKEFKQRMEEAKKRYFESNVEKKSSSKRFVNKFKRK